MPFRKQIAELEAAKSALPPGDPMHQELDAAIEEAKLASYSGPTQMFQGVYAPDPDANPVAAEDVPAAPPKKNPKLPSASKASDSYRDPEYIPGDAGMGAGVPAEVGGSLQTWEEPNIEQFRQELGPILVQHGVDPAQIDEGSDEFKEYADEKWKDFYDQAKANGVPVARLNYMNDPEWRKNAGTAASVTGKAIEYGTKALHGVTAGAYGYLEGRTAPGAADVASKALEYLPGATGKENEEQRFLSEEYPISKTIGTIAGAVDPRSWGARATRGAMKLAGEAPGLLKRVAMQSGIGGALGVTGGVTGDAARQATDVMEGRSSGFDAEQMAKRAQIEGLLGMGLGGAGEVVGSGAGKLRDFILPPAERGPAEAAGFTFGFGGPKPPPNVEAAIKTAADKGVAPEAVLADEFAPRYAQAGSAFAEEAKPVMGTVTETRADPYHVSLEGKSKEALTNDLVALEMVGNRAESARRNAELKDFIGRVQINDVPNTQELLTLSHVGEGADAGRMSLASGDRPTNAYTGGGFSEGLSPNLNNLTRMKELGIWKPKWVSADEARALAEREGGIVLDAASAGQIGEHPPQGVAAGLKVVLTPRQLTPRQLSELYKKVGNNPNDYSEELVKRVEEMAKGVKGTRISVSGNNEVSTDLAEMTRLAEWAGAQPQKQMVLQGRRYQSAKLPQGMETEQGFKTWEQLSEPAKLVEVTKVMKEGLPPEEVARTLDAAGIPQSNGNPIPWEQMSADQRLKVVDFLKSFPKGKEVMEADAMRSVAKAGGVTKDLEGLAGSFAGLRLMGRKDHNLPLVMGIHGPKLIGVPRQLLTGLDPILSGARNRSGVAPRLAQPINEIDERRKKEKRLEDK